MEDSANIQLIKVPDWHISIVRNRIMDYEENPKMALDFNEVMRELEKKFQ